MIPTNNWIVVHPRKIPETTSRRNKQGFICLLRWVSHTKKSKSAGTPHLVTILQARRIPRDLQHIRLLDETLTEILKGSTKDPPLELTHTSHLDWILPTKWDVYRCFRTLQSLISWTQQKWPPRVFFNQSPCFSLGVMKWCTQIVGRDCTWKRDRGVFLLQGGNRTV